VDGLRVIPRGMLHGESEDTIPRVEEMLSRVERREKMMIDESKVKGHGYCCWSFLGYTVLIILFFQELQPYFSCCQFHF
jgi:hypothetical protein